MRDCAICGHETAGRRKIHPQVCGPCLYGKPVGWWDDLPAILEKLGAVPRGDKCGRLSQIPPEES